MSDLERWLNGLSEQEKDSLINKAWNHANGYTEQAGLAEFLTEIQVPTPFQLRLNKFGRRCGELMVGSHHPAHAKQWFLPFEEDWDEDGVRFWSVNARWESAEERALRVKGIEVFFSAATSTGVK